ncbi:class I SAM-dependent methyltransferase [Roseibium sp. HPY-6]|uniref:class I SAM-dependent methyltransferase n=1 Tax=Roseibium sp. HPY-6 TaxID=3229852 RepID=UPI00338FD321
MYLSFIEAVDGDYLEFGVFTGSSFTHAMRCAKASERFLPNGKVMPRFFGFDSFSGFGDLAKEDVHPFYQDENFSTSFEDVDKRARKTAKSLEYQLVPGFFSESLKDGPEKFELSKARIVFIDSDTYSSSLEALTFCLPLIQDGTIIILDDYFSYRGSRKHGVAAAFSQIVDQGKLDVRQLMTYGMGGCCFVVSAVDPK